MKSSRRFFLAAAASASATAAFGVRGDAQMQHMGHMNHDHPKPERPATPRLPALLCKVTGTIGIDAAFQMLTDGRDTLDAALHVCQTQEDNPQDQSTGLGALPNMQGEVQLDACCFHGPTRRAAAVASVNGVRNASLLARALMDHTGDCLLVGEDAQVFANAQGFTTEHLLTGRGRQTHALWKKLQSTPDALGEGSYDPSFPEPARRARFLPKSQEALEQLVRKLEPLGVQAGVNPALSWRAVFDSIFPAAEPVYAGAIDARGQISAACSSGGRPWRLAGISSDIAAIGAGCFVDPDVGSAGSSGSAEANIKIVGARTIVENMRMGMSPEDAGMDALHRIARWYNNDVTALRFVEIVYYILRKDGAYGSVSLWRDDKTGQARQYTVMDGVAARRTEDCRFLMDGNPVNGSAGLHQGIA